MIVFAAIMPHPPESISGTRKPENLKLTEKTLLAFEQLRVEIEQSDPETIVIISPHAYSEPYSFVINSGSELVGNLAELGLDETFSYINDIKIADSLAFQCLVNDLPAHLHPSFLDYGTLIPLYYLTKNIKPKIVQLSFSMMDYNFHFRYGEILRKVINDSGQRVAIIASGSLSHKLTPNAPAGYYSEAKKFDADVIHHLGSDDLASIMNFDQQVVAKSAECGLRSIIILLGALHGRNYKFKLLSYEYPLGVGYMTARLL